MPLEIVDVCKSFGKKRVLDHVAFSVKPGEMFGLIGLNGAGKTTLIKIILGLLRQDSGETLILGSHSQETKNRRHLTYLPEKFQPSLFLKGKEFLSLTLSYYGKKFDRATANQKAEILRLDPAVLDQKISSYSKGMTQKLGLLSALLTECPLLILDEPMSGLDPSARIYLKEALLDHVKAGNTVFFSSHILSDIDEICDRIAIIHGSEIVFTGTPKAFKLTYKDKSLERSFLKSIKAA